MGSPFPSDSDRRSKLDVAKCSLLSIITKLTESDRVSVIQFDDRQDILFPLQHVTTETIPQIEVILSKIVPRGGTNLGNGIASGFKHLFEAENITPHESLITDIRQKRTRRVVFMTDMESTPEDETNVINISQNAVRGRIITPQPPIRNLFAGPPPIATPSESESSEVSPISSNSIFTSIIGIGVDLSVRTVEKICAITGARYISAINASEFMSTVADEFPYDISPVAFNIRVTLPSPYSINKIYGASELNSVPNKSTSFTISSEFANPLDCIQVDSERVEYQMKGGILLIRINEEKSETKEKKVSWKTSAEQTAQTTPRRSTRNKPSNDVNSPSTIPTSTNMILVEWTDIQNQNKSITLPFVAPNPLPEDEEVSSECDEGLIKAVCLMTYVDYMERYAVSSEKPLLTVTPSDADTLRPFFELPFSEIISLPSLENLPYSSSIPNRISICHSTITQYQNLKSYFLQVFSQLSDDSLFTSNQNILQTIQQVIELEIKELQDDLNELRSRLGLNLSSVAQNQNDGDCPHSYLCPISLTLMKDPVIACDGHSYEKESITKWFETHNTSPITNLPLANKMLIENHTLKGAIEEYLSRTNSGAVSSDNTTNRTPTRSTPTRGKGRGKRMSDVNSADVNSSKKRNR